MPGRIGGVEVDHPSDDGLPLIRKPSNAEPADFDQSGEGLSRPDHKAAGMAIDMNTVVADEAGKRQRTVARGQKQIPREPRLARTGGAADQDRPGAYQNSRGMDRGSVGHQFAGRRTMKRAPRTGGGTPPIDGPNRFSARMAPPWASMICLEIDSPSPEFWPNPCSGRSV